MMANEFSYTTVIGAIIIAISYISIFSLVKEPNKKTINALIIAGAGAVYWTGGLGVIEFLFGPVMFYLAYNGLKNYTYIALGWIMHTIWDIVHHFYANPIVPFSPSSSAGCAICDSILAIWFLYNAPNIFRIFNQKSIL